jgi:hypothetical protein
LSNIFRNSQPQVASNLNSLAYVAAEKLFSLFAAETADECAEALAEAVFETDLGRGVAAGAFEAAARRGRVDAETGGACAALRAGMICGVVCIQLNRTISLIAAAAEGDGCAGASCRDSARYLSDLTNWSI